MLGMLGMLKIVTDLQLLLFCPSPLQVLPVWCNNILTTYFSPVVPTGVVQPD